MFIKKLGLVKIFELVLFAVQTFDNKLTRFHSINEISCFRKQVQHSALIIK